MQSMLLMFHAKPPAQCLSPIVLETTRAILYRQGPPASGVDGRVYQVAWAGLHCPGGLCSLQNNNILTNPTQLKAISTEIPIGRASAKLSHSMFSLRF